MTDHSCPEYCHRCPVLDGDVMPSCMGTAARCSDPKSLDCCTCHRQEVAASVEERLTRIENALAETGAL